MNAPPPPVGNVIRYQHPPRQAVRRPDQAERAGCALRLEGSLAAVVTLAPVIPIFPRLTPSSRPAATARRGELVPFFG
jgi:hypothetical protein